MDLRPGIRVRARGLIWDVIAVASSTGCDCLDLRCVDGDMAGLEWQLYVPPDQVEWADEGYPGVLWRNIDLCEIDVITLHYDRSSDTTSITTK